MGLLGNIRNAVKSIYEGGKNNKSQSSPTPVTSSQPKASTPIPKATPTIITLTPIKSTPSSSGSSSSGAKGWAPSGSSGSGWVPPPSSGRGSIVQNNSSPTGYSDVLGQPVSVNSSLINVQQQSQATQDQSLTLARQNDYAKRDAAQRDTNYMILNLPSGSDKNLSYQIRGTEVTTSPFKYLGPPISLEPIIYTKQTGSFTDVTTGQNIKITETRYNAGVLSNLGLIEDRPATSSEVDFINSQPGILQASIESPSKASRISSELIGVAKQDIYSSNLGGKEFITQFGINEKNIEIAASYSAPSVFFSGLSQLGVPGAKSASEFSTNLISAPIKEIYQKPITNVALIGAGFGIGLGVSSLAAGVESSAFKLGSMVSPNFGFKAGASAKGITNVIGLGSGATFAGMEGASFFGKAIYSKSAGEFGGLVGLEALKTGEMFGGAYLGIKSAGKVVDVFRTRGTTSISTESIVAPEFYAGQKYPLLAKGQTAGELKSEFYTPKLPGEKGNIPRAFTASSGDFGSKALTQKGTSEVPGLFGSADLSPTFLKVVKSREGAKAFSFDVSPSKPTAIRLTLKDIEFAPGVTSKTSRPVGIQKEFFEGIGGTGRSVIPFMKAEKEVVTSFNTPIKQFGKEFSFEFEGRKIPVKQFEIDLGTTNIKSSKDTFSLGKTSSYYSGTTSSAYVTPSSLISLGYSSSSYSPSSITSSISYRPSSGKSLSSYNSSGISKGVSSIGGSLSSGSRSNISSVSYPSSSYSSKSFSGSQSFRTSTSQFKYSKGVPLDLGMDFGRKKLEEKKAKKRLSEWVIAPSFTGIVENIQMKNPLKVSKTFGVTPFQTRGLFVGKKAKSQKYYQLTDL